MKRVLSAAALAAAGTLCHAQSTLSVYARLDAGINYTNHERSSANTGAGSVLGAESGNYGASWIGFRGSEDLGDGNSAIFDLENGINMTNGAGAGGTGVAFNRASYAGLHSTKWGEMRVGRDLAISNYQWDMDPMMQELYSDTALMRWRNGQVFNNTISYQSPVLAGWDVFGQYSLGESATGFNAGAPGQFGRSDALQLTYTGEKFEFRGQYEEIRDQDGKFTNIFLQGKEAFLGVAYKLTPEYTIMGGYNHLAAPDTTAGIANKANHFWFGTKAQVTQHWLLSAGVYRMLVGQGAGDATHDAGGHATLAALGAMYYFSKNTFWYVAAAHTKNAQTSNFGVGGSNPGNDNSNLGNPLLGQSQSGVYTGLNTSF